MISTHQHKSWQQYLLITMMLVNLAVMLGLIWRIQHNQAQQKITVNAVLNDYAAMAAQQFARNAKSQIGYAAMFDLGQAWSGAKDPSSTIVDFLNTPTEQLNPSRGRVKAALINVQLIDHVSQSLTAIIHPQLTTKINAVIPTMEVDDGPGIKAIHDLNSHNLVFQSLIKINQKYSVITQYSDTFVNESLDFMYTNKPVLPTVLTENKDNMGLFFELQNPAGQILWQSSPDVLSNSLESNNKHSINIDEDYGALFAGFKLTAHIDQILASQLIIGGLPKSQLPQLLMLIGLALSALLIMFWLYRRTNLLSQQKEQFIARASHELKTPLTQIRLFAETMALKRINSTATKDQYINIIFQESIRLSQLVDNILNQHQIDQGSLPIQFESIELKPYLQELLNQQQILWQSKSITINLTIPTDDNIQTDPNQLKQVLINLLDNAVKFGPEKQTITLLGQHQDNSYTLSITDQGPGIPKQHLHRVMNSYERLARDENRGINGNGLGLAIAQQLINNLNGQLNFESSEHGTCAIITLPQSEVLE